MIHLVSRDAPHAVRPSRSRPAAQLATTALLLAASLAPALAHAQTAEPPAQPKPVPGSIAPRAATAIVRFGGSDAFADALRQGCDGAGACAWVRGVDSHADQHDTHNALGYTTHGDGVQLGGSLPVSEHVRLSTSLAYGHERLKDDAGGRAKAHSLRGGAAATYRNGRLELAAGVDGGRDRIDTERPVTVGDADAVLRGKPKSWDVGAHVRAAYRQPVGGAWTVTPFVEGDLDHVHGRSFTETSAQARLRTPSDTDTLLSGAVGAELGASLPVDRDRLTLAPYARVAVAAFDNGDWAARPRDDAAALAPGSDAYARLPHALTELAVGARLAGRGTWNVQAQYGVDLGRDYTAQTGSLRVATRF